MADNRLPPVPRGDINQNNIPDQWESLEYLIKLLIPVILLLVGVVLAIFGTYQNNEKATDLGKLLAFGGSTGTGLTNSKRK